MPLNLSAVSGTAGSPASAPRAESKPAQPTLSRSFVRKTDGAEVTVRAAQGEDTSVLTLEDAQAAAKAAREGILAQAGVAMLAQANQGPSLALGLLR
jgi:hypothetical protein